VFLTIEIYVPKSCVHNSLKYTFYFLNKGTNKRFGDTMIANIKVDRAFNVESSEEEEVIDDSIELSNDVIYSFAG